MPSNFCLFEPLKKHLAGKWFTTDSEMKQGVTYWLQTIDNDSFYAKIQNPGLIMRQMLKCQWWLFCALLPTCPVYTKVIINFSALECYYLSFLNSFVHTKGKIWGCSQKKIRQWIACYWTYYVAQYWHVVRQGTWHSTGMFLDKVHGTVLACY